MLPAAAAAGWARTPAHRVSSHDTAWANASGTRCRGVLFTHDLDHGVRVAESPETGRVELNAVVTSNAAAPFSGIKASGFGREGGVHGIGEYLSTEYIGVSVSAG